MTAVSAENPRHFATGKRLEYTEEKAASGNAQEGTQHNERKEKKSAR